jgi:hypothetical protein
MMPSAVELRAKKMQLYLTARESELLDVFCVFLGLLEETDRTSLEESNFESSCILLTHHS